MGINMYYTCKVHPASDPLIMQEPEELFEVTAQCLMSGQDRDAISGWGAIIHVM